MRANIVGTVIVLSLLIWVPASCVISYVVSQHSIHVSYLLFSLTYGLCKEKKHEITMEVGGWVQVSLGILFCFGKSSQNSPKPVLIYWSSIPCVFCLYIGWRGWVGGVSCIQFFWDFFNFANPLIPSSGIIGICLECPRPLPSVFLYPPLAKNVMFCSDNNSSIASQEQNYVPWKRYITCGGGT